MAKIPLYSDDQIKEIIQAWENGATIAELEAQTGRSKNSLIAKLNRLGLYKKAETEPKNRGIKKQELADKIAAICGLLENDADSLTKCTKLALQGILKKLEAGEQYEEN